MQGTYFRLVQEREAVQVACVKKIDAIINCKHSTKYSICVMLSLLHAVHTAYLNEFVKKPEMSIVNAKKI